MASLREYFDADFGHTLKINEITTVTYNENSFEITGFLSFDFTSNSLFHSYFIDSKTLDLLFFKEFLKSLSTKSSWAFAKDVRMPSTSLLKGLAISVGNFDPLIIQAQFPGEDPINMADLQSYGRIFLYSETTLTKNEISELREFGKTLNLYIQFRSKDFSIHRSLREQPLAFISHDSRDKETIARALALRLQNNDCPVWYDEYSLKVGDNLRESIEKGLKECRKCILILTPNFLANNGWTKIEFNSIFTRQIIEDEKLILPIWCGIDKKLVYEYSPSLLNIVGLQWNTGLDNIVTKLTEAVKGSQF
jgi:hypothetical protein